MTLWDEISKVYRMESKITWPSFFRRKKLQGGREKRENNLLIKRDLRTSLVAQMVKNMPSIQETQVRSWGQEDTLEKERATFQYFHSCIPAWEIPWTEDPGGLQSVQSQKSQTMPRRLNNINKQCVNQLHCTDFIQILKQTNLEINCAQLLLLLLSHFSRVRLCATPSLGFSRQEHWSGLPFPSPIHESEKWKWSGSVMSDCLRPHGLQPTRLLHPWDFPGKSTGVGCHCLLRHN